MEIKIEEMMIPSWSCKCLVLNQGAAMRLLKVPQYCTLQAQHSFWIFSALLDFYRIFLYFGMGLNKMSAILNVK